MVCLARLARTVDTFVLDQQPPSLSACRVSIPFVILRVLDQRRLLLPE